MPFFGGRGGADGEVQLPESIVVTTAAAVARVKSVNKTVPNFYTNEKFVHL